MQKCCGSNALPVGRPSTDDSEEWRSLARTSAEARPAGSALRQASSQAKSHQILIEVLPADGKRIPFVTEDLESQRKIEMPCRGPFSDG
jgi:hypothetical protein